MISDKQFNNPRGFSGHVAIVTGGGVGIGFEICRQLTLQGASVLLNDIDEALTAKAGLEMLAKNLVIELSPYKINVNAIAPGATLTERTVYDADYENTWSRITPLGRPATTTDIANAALFMVSEKAKHITGQSLIID